MMNGASTLPVLYQARRHLRRRGLSAMFFFACTNVTVRLQVPLINDPHTEAPAVSVMRWVVEPCV